MVFVGLTGGIASGKSMVSTILGTLGAYIIDADVIAHELIKPGLPACNEIVERFGREILLDDGSIDRSHLGNMIFKDPQKRVILNAILHPKIFEEAERLRKKVKKESPDAIVIFDAALLIETGAYRLADIVILVCVDEKTQVSRLINRDKLTEEEALERVGAQMSIEEKKKHADFIIDASKSKENVKKQVRYIFERLKVLSRKGKNVLN